MAEEDHAVVVADFPVEVSAVVHMVADLTEVLIIIQVADTDHYPQVRILVEIGTEEDITVVAVVQAVYSLRLYLF